VASTRADAQLEKGKGKRRRFGELEDDGDGDEREAWTRATEVEEEAEEHEQDSLTPATEEESDHDDRQRPPREQIGADEMTKEQHGSGGETRGEEKRPLGQEREVEDEEKGDEIVERFPFLYNTIKKEFFRSNNNK